MLEGNCWEFIFLGLHWGDGSGNGGGLQVGVCKQSWYLKSSL